MDQTCALLIIGAGYAGVCAFNAAAPYLKSGDRVIVVDKGREWGGQWVDQYDFVRLHQPFSVFTAGSRSWAIEGSKPPGHLANKKEILAHFDDIIKAATEESQLDVVTLFGYEFGWDHTIVNGAVECTVRWRGTGGVSNTDARLTPPASIRIRADRMIKAMGFQIQIKEPLTLPTQRVISLCPADILQPAFNMYMRGEGRDKPIYFVGSGKTAMDCIYNLCKDDVSSVFKNRLHCLAGRGMLFINRDNFFPNDWFKRNIPGTWLGPHYILPMLERYNGTNELECFKFGMEMGYFHSPIPDPQNFILGILSVAERNLIEDVLCPVEKKVHKAHLMSVIDDPDDPQWVFLKLRRSTGANKDEIYFHRVPAGTVIVNCTDSLGTDEQAASWEHLVQDGGLVLAPQAALAFTGPSANVFTHAWYQGTLGNHWRKLLRIAPGAENKAKGGMGALHLLTVNMFLMLSLGVIPPDVAYIDRSNMLNVFPTHRRALLGLSFMRKIPAIWDKSREYFPLRWDDECDTTKNQHAGTADVPIGFAGRLEGAIPPAKL